MSVTLVHPAKAVGQNEMPFDRDTRVVPSNTVLDEPWPPTGRGDLGDLNLQSKFASHIVAKSLQIAELLL